MRTKFLSAICSVLLLFTPQTASAETLTVAGGCFWCVESDFEKVAGVHEVTSGFTGGTVTNPTYKQVTKGRTGHYEAVQIEYDPAQVSRPQLLTMFLRSIDPTDAGGQFCDRGQSYSTAIFYGDAKSKSEAKSALAAAEQKLGTKIVTRLLPEATFFPAGAEHQDYYKGKKRVLTRFGIKKQSQAYNLYREACGRDNRVKELWGAEAPFASG